MTVRLATEADLPRLREIVDAAYARYLPRMDRPPAPMTRDLRPEIQSCRVWVAGDPVVGVICLEADDDSVLVENVAVHPDAQGNGLGRRLMEFAEQHARRLALRRLRLYTNEVMTESLAVYRRLGYVETGRGTENGYRRVFMEKTLA